MQTPLREAHQRERRQGARGSQVLLGLRRKAMLLRVPLEWV